MSELGSGSGSSYPSSLDTDATLEVNSPNAGKTKARAEVANDLASAIMAIQTELGTDPAGTLTDIKTFLQTEHGVDGTHSDSVLMKLAGEQTVTGKKTFSANVVWAKGADLASAATLALGTDGNYFDVTGTTSITAISSVGVGAIIKLHFDSALALTHHATDLVLPSDANITCVAGDEFEFIEYATGKWRMTNGSRVPTARLTDSAVTTVKIADANITVAKLKSTTGSLSLYNPGESITQSDTILPGGEYGFESRWRISADTTVNELYAIPLKYPSSHYMPAGSYSSQIYLYFNLAGAGGKTLYVQQRYIEASRPYEPYRKNDVVPLFVFGLVEKSSGKIIATYVAPDPPWANNGPTVINPLGLVQRIKKQKSGVNIADLKSGKTKPKDFGSLLENFEEPTKEEIKQALAIPITQEDKNADMALIPHPFGSFDSAKHVVVILSPTDSKFCYGLSRLHEMGESVAEVLHGDYINIDNTPMEGLVTPESVMAVGARWK